MQAFRGTIRLLQKQNLTASCIGHCRHPRAYLSNSESSLHGWSKLESNTSAPIESSIPGSQLRKDMLPTMYWTSSRLSSLQQAAVMPLFSKRCMTTVGDSSQSSQDPSQAVTDVPPRIKFKRLDKTAKHIMQILDKEAVQEVRSQRDIPDIKPGYIIQLKMEVPENKRRNSLVKGIVIARRNAGLNSTFRLRRLVAGVGVESLFPLYSPNIKEIKVLEKKKVRRAKLYYLRDKMNPLKKH